jgi:oligopeptidase B
VLGGFDKKNYVTERLWATARDGTRVPVTVLHPPTSSATAAPRCCSTATAATAPPWTRASTRTCSLLDRGMVYAIAHIRGGQEMGRAWYEDGKLLKKINTFTDFIDVTDFLVAEGYAAPTASRRLAAAPAAC